MISREISVSLRAFAALSLDAINPRRRQRRANDFAVIYERTRSRKQGPLCFQMLAAEDIYTFVAVDESWMALMHL